MLPTFFLLCLFAGSSIAGPHVINRIELERIEKEMSREVEEEFSGKEDQEELELLKQEFAASHSGNETLIDIPTELDINANNTEFYEGDIQLTPDQWKVALDFDPENPLRRRQGLTDMASLWKPIGAPVIPYAFLPDFPESYQKVVKDAMTFWEQRTCIKFRPAAKGDTGGILFNHKSAGCSSWIGSRGEWQQLSLQAPGCMNVPIITHELSHAFGTLHVQSREDRDTYVRIDTANVAKGHEHDFRKEPNGYSTYGVPYEFGSIMHYPPNIFGKVSTKPTIYARPPYQNNQGSMDGPATTFWDTVLINRMYKCTDKCPRQMACQNGGVTDGADCNKCFCPRGWAGSNCERRPCDAQIVNVSPTVQLVKLDLTGAFTGNLQEKLVILQAPPGRKIEAVLKMFGPSQSARCRSFGLEIVQSQDTRTSGLRYCSQPPQNPTKFVSEGNSILLWLYRVVNNPVSATVSVRLI